MQFVRQLKASRNMELTDSVLKNSFNQLLLQLKSPSHVTSMVFHLGFCWPHRGRLSVGNISVSLRFLEWSTGKPGNEIPSVQVKFSARFVISSRVYTQITGFTGIF